ncbi:hypothetical protein [Lunatimonas salinarum]|uniref:hypothetical protein n=1 Tax=Lunatimonas salinarum TaxID=1774590 RepID=UPI001FD7AA1F|nr:hypothetical protein [Lunatimonas salinarum]
MKKFWYSSLVWLLIFFLNSGHVGSPGVVYEGLLGNHRMLAHIEPPDVIPGIALVTVILPENPSGISLEAKPVYWSVGLDGTPSSDPLLAVKGEPGKYQLDLWFMGSGASSVQLIMTEGGQLYEATIPILAMPTAQKEMPLGLGVVLSALGLFLVVLMVTIVMAAVGESLRPAGDASPVSSKRKWVGLSVGTLTMLLILWGGKVWWESEADKYQRNIYKPIQGEVKVVSSGEGLFLDLTVDLKELQNGGISRKMSYLIPDHGKLMHLFLIKKGGLDVFAHLHPERLDSLHFRTPIPDLPPGEYHVFADITRFTGFAETIVGDLHIPEQSLVEFASLRTVLGRDDSFLVTNSINAASGTLDSDFMLCGIPGIRVGLGEGFEAIWESDVPTYESGRLYNLTFALFDPDANAAVLEPYLGMMGHAVVMKHDGSVYIHLHPTGNYSMGAQEMMVERFKSRKQGYRGIPSGMTFMDSVDQVLAWLEGLPDIERDSLLMGDMLHLSPESPEHEEHQLVSFPYAFPEAGSYRIWVQVKINGKVRQAAFDVDVS